MYGISKIALLTVLLAVTFPLMAASVNDALDEIEKGNHRTAAEMLRPLVEAGDLRAQALMGKMLLSGQGIQKNLPEAIRLLKISADSGNGGAQAILAVLYWEGSSVPQDLTVAKMRAKQSADQGNPVGQMVLGSLLVSELDESDIIAGVDLLQKSVAQRFSPAEYQLGKMTTLGWVVARDIGTGVAMMERAASENPGMRAQADLIIGMQSQFESFRNGSARLTCEISCAIAAGANSERAARFLATGMWPELAAITVKVGHLSDLAYYYLGRAAEGMGLLPAAGVYYDLAIRERYKCNGVFNNCGGLDVPSLATAGVSRVRARALAMQAAEAERFAQARRERAEKDAFTARQRQVEADAEALKQDVARANGGEPQALRNMSERYFIGSGVPQDFAIASAWLLRAAEAGDIDAQLSLGERLMHGRQLPRDELRGEHWLKQASDRGNTAASDLLLTLYSERRQKAQEQESARATREKRAAEAQAMRLRQEQTQREEQDRKRRAESAARVKSL